MSVPAGQAAAKGARDAAPGFYSALRGDLLTGWLNFSTGNAFKRPSRLSPRGSMGLSQRHTFTSAGLRAAASTRGLQPAGSTAFTAASTPWDTTG